MFVRRRRVAAWIAAVALALQALAPLLAQARTQDPMLPVPVCSVDGATHDVDPGKGEAPRDEQGGGHCKLCLVGCVHDLALAGAPRSVAVAARARRSAGPAGAPELLGEAPRYRLARPRAPPRRD
ncbi:MAG: DUF2946 family protein [Betaproteobacteria bacterium]|nr:DUF2946 family protein [Betaproteobacteria bacterium]